MLSRHTAELPPAFRPGAREVLGTLVKDPGRTPIVLTNSLGDKVQRLLATLSLDGAVAVALRNRWRRMQVSEPLRSEITPKNILMIGPTGVGKTYIIRLIADKIGVPFVSRAKSMSANSPNH